MNAKIRIFIVVFLLAVIVIVGWFFFGGWPRKEIRNVLLISIDTCRSDYLSCYGYWRKTTPNIDKLAQESVLFENTIAPIPLTLPSHSSMLTGTNPPYHGVHDNLDYKLGQSNVTLAEICKDAGFTTGAIVSALIMDSRFGIDQGFDSYNDEFEEELSTVGIPERRGGEASRFAVEWLEKHKNERFFFFLHYYDPHSKYEAPEPFHMRFWDNPYAGEIAYTDYCIGQVIEKLKELDLYDSTLLIITADHGEMLGEHGEQSHSYFIYQSAIKVPLIFKLPGQRKAKRIKEVVGLVDIVPTVCSLLGIELPSEVQGIDLSGYFGIKRRPALERYLYCESLYPTKYKGNSLLGVVSDRWKYIQTTRPELYDLGEDPKESNNLVTKEPQRARILQDKLKQILEEQVREEESGFEPELDDRTLQDLRSLGYVGGGVEVDFEFNRSKKDPKDLINFHKSTGAVIFFIFQKKYAEAKELCEKLLVEQPDSLRSHLNMAKIAMGQDDYAGAIPYLDNALKLDPNQWEAHNDLGMVLTRVDRLEEAVKHFEEALRLRPGKPYVHSNLGLALMRQEKLDEAIERFRKAIELNPKLAVAHRNLGVALIKKGELEEAVKHYTEWAKLKPEQPEAHRGLASTLARQNKLEEAIASYRKSLELDPNQPVVLNAAGATLVLLGEPNEAVNTYLKSLESKPDQPFVRKIVADIFYQQAKLDDAIGHYTEALRLEPNMPLVRNSLAEVYFQQGKIAEALAHWNEALKIKPDWVDVLNNIAWCKAAYEDEDFYNPNEAVQSAQKACELTDHNEPRLLDTLSVAYSAVSKFPEAIETAEKAIELTIASEQKELAEEIQKHLELYKAGEPYRKLP